VKRTRAFSIDSMASDILSIDLCEIKVEICIVLQCRYQLPKDTLAGMAILCFDTIRRVGWIGVSMCLLPIDRNICVYQRAHHVWIEIHRCMNVLITYTSKYIAVSTGISRIDRNI